MSITLIIFGILSYLFSLSLFVLLKPQKSLQRILYIVIALLISHIMVYGYEYPYPIAQFFVGFIGTWLGTVIANKINIR